MKHRRFRPVIIGLASVAVALSVGCGEYGRGPRRRIETAPNRTEKTAAEESVAAAPQGAATAGAAQQAGVDPPGGAVRTDSSGRKWVDDVPLDVWFDDPLAVAGSGIELTGAAQGTSSATSGNSPVARAGSDSGAHSNAPASGATAADPGTTTGGTGEDWTALVPAEVLDAEMKSIRNELNAALQSVGKYNAKYKDVAVMGATLAAAGAIAVDHAGPLRWKEVAPHVRDLGARIEEAAQGVGSEPYDAARKQYEMLAGLLGGNSPAGLEAAEPHVEFSQCVSRGGLMQRMERGFQTLKKEMTTEKDFGSRSETAAHEASLLAAFGRVIAARDYDSADEPEYAAHAQELVKSSLEMARAARTSDFAGFTAARDRVQKKCDECHAEYRF